MLFAEAFLCGAKEPSAMRQHDLAIQLQMVARQGCDFNPFCWSVGEQETVCNHFGFEGLLLHLESLQY
jgi:hypothetical protein